MSILSTYSIRSILNIKDENIKFNDRCHIAKKTTNIDTHFFDATLTYRPTGCPKCGILNNDKNIIKNGFKTSNIKMPDLSNIPTILRLKKQRFFCKECSSTFIAETNLVSSYCHISNTVKQKICLDLSKEISFKNIAKDNRVSINSVIRVLRSLDDYYKNKYDYLPEVLSFDEFKSVKGVSGAMSFIYIDGTNSSIIDVLPDRRYFQLEKHFLKYDKSIRDKVKYIVCDMYQPYFKLAKNLFPKAKVVLDTFHIVQSFMRGFNITRIKIMNSFNKKSYEYKKLKRYWKLLLKDKRKLKCSSFHNYTHFKNWQSEDSAVKNILEIDELLKLSYNFMQTIRFAIELKNFELFNKTIEFYLSNKLLSEKLITVSKTAIKYYNYIKNTFSCNYSNGRIEGTINKIKNIKRVSYGYRSFINLRLRVLLSFEISKAERGIND